MEQPCITDLLFVAVGASLFYVIAIRPRCFNSKKKSNASENTVKGACKFDAEGKAIISAPSSTATGSESLCLRDKVIAVQGSGGADGVASSSSLPGNSEYFSTRAEVMMQSKSKFSDQVEYEIEFSKPHWTEVTRYFFSEEEEEEDQENWSLFAQLEENPEYGKFFKYWSGFPEFTLGRKIAEGGQAEIYEVVYAETVPDDVPPILLKVFKGGSLLEMRQLWPLAVLRNEVFQCVLAGTILEDGRFAFMMQKCWGDLRKLIDQAMQEKNNQGSPFPCQWNGKTMYAEGIMWEVAFQMEILNQRDVFHRDLKASNILLQPLELSRKEIIVADFETSIGVVGTTFWRAPEILLALKNRDAFTFTEKADVYSYGMTCFEIATGRLPFDGELEPSRYSYDLVIQGRRPKLPSNLHPALKILITNCWDPNPNRRPTFFFIRLWGILFWIWNPILENYIVCWFFYYLYVAGLELLFKPIYYPVFYDRVDNTNLISYWASAILLWSKPFWACRIERFNFGKNKPKWE